MFSGFKPVSSGVPQGGNGSPDLFNLTVKDLPKYIKNSKLYQFADDPCLLKEIYNESDINDLQIDLIDFEKYCQKMKFKLNSEKSVDLRITLKDCSELES